MIFPQINPVAFSIGFFDIRWYSLAYIAGIFIGYYLFIHLAGKSGYEISKKALDDIIVYFIAGIMIGGRLGFVLFYDLDRYLTEPFAIFKTWEGGMSFHGALIGLIMAIYLLCRKHKLQLLRLFDLLCCVVSPGIFLGRIANFINGELYGRVTDVEWGIIFPHAGYLPRHPSQLYEALGEGLILFAVMQLLFHFTNLRNKKGALTGIFLIGYSTIRMLIENFREPDFQVGYVFNSLTLGQLLCMPMLMLGIFLLFRRTLIK
ncbi:prolipoprotein diacylglyceryl transferase [Candidatus Jidaibacter acanthamoebae]|uniref:prolipoprotein diacylglyceryl transferase n=1 Tax=Candidatus Jidaibacter acanthamoebae TaxID=86105 RepID=UPI00057DDAC0|nr:prolipoprotein diacylglyceryl transferase [Candidatus Jidaibacter acanthamoeba]